TLADVDKSIELVVKTEKTSYEEILKRIEDLEVYLEDLQESKLDIQDKIKNAELAALIYEELRTHHNAVEKAEKDLQQAVSKSVAQNVQNAVAAELSKTKVTLVEIDRSLN